MEGGSTSRLLIDCRDQVKNVRYLLTMRRFPRAFDQSDRFTEIAIRHRCVGNL